MNQTGFQNALDSGTDDFGSWFNPSNQTRGELNSHLGPVQRFQLNQALEKRGGLRFTYAPLHGDDGAGEYSYAHQRKVWLPFYENPLISESRKANYANNKVFLRNEPIRLYTGSEARKFKVDIHYSLIHMAAMVGSQDLTDMFGVTEGQEAYDDTMAIASYLHDTLLSDTGSNAQLDATQATQEMYDRSNVQDGPWGGNRWWKNSSAASEGSRLYWNFALMWVMRTGPTWVKHHQVLQKVINNVRSAVISTRQMPVKGPPIVELKWGTMYNYTPCIVTDYKIQPIENAGYDTKSLTAQRLKISLTLEEMRNVNGNQWGDPTIGGDLPGWDTIANLGTIDPTADRIINLGAGKTMRIDAPSQGLEF